MSNIPPLYEPPHKRWRCQQHSKCILNLKWIKLNKHFRLHLHVVLGSACWFYGKTLDTLFFGVTRSERERGKSVSHPKKNMKGFQFHTSYVCFWHIIEFSLKILLKSSSSLWSVCANACVWNDVWRFVVAGVSLFASSWVVKSLLARDNLWLCSFSFNFSVKKVLNLLNEFFFLCDCLSSPSLMNFPLMH
jgi:hypothetical protein